MKLKPKILLACFLMLLGVVTAAPQNGSVQYSYTITTYSNGVGTTTTYSNGVKTTKQVTGPQTPTFPSPGSMAMQQGSDIKLIATVSNNSPYVQQGVIYTITLYIPDDIGVRVPYGTPSLGNCAYEQLDVPHKLVPGTLNGKHYFVAEVYKLLVFPTKEGKCVIGGGDFVVPTDFGDYNVRLNDVTLNVKPLPGIADHGDINGVGNYTVTARLMNSHFQRNEAGTLRVTVKGSGNPTFVSMPDLGNLLPAGLKVLNTETSIDKKKLAFGVEATVTFDCAIVAAKEGSYDLPALAFTFFDPKKGEWYTRTTKPLSIEVSQGSAMQTDGSELSFDPTFSPLPQKAPEYSFMISSALYWMAYAVLFVMLVVALVLYRKRVALLADPELMRLKKANAMARMRLRLAERAMKKGDTDMFYTEVLKALWGYLSDKLTMPTSELSRSNISAELQAVAVDVPLVERTISFIDDCEFAKYGNSANADMMATYREACDLLNALETSIKQTQNTTQQ